MATSGRYVRKHYPVDALADASWRERTELVEAMSRACDFIPETDFMVEGTRVTCRQRLVQRRSFPTEKTALLPLLSRLGDHLEALLRANLVHGDINRKNVLFDGKSLVLVDWEPSLRQVREGKNVLMYTPPYIARSDLLGGRLSAASDRVGFYFFCRRLLFPQTLLPVCDIMANRQAYATGKTKKWIDILPVDEHAFEKLPYGEILSLAQVAG